MKIVTKLSELEIGRNEFGVVTLSVNSVGGYRKSLMLLNGELEALGGLISSYLLDEQTKKEEKVNGV